jgi:hypothetical protein
MRAAAGLAASGSGKAAALASKKGEKPAQT